jgi:hypothetical protein
MNDDLVTLECRVYQNDNIYEPLFILIDVSSRPRATTGGFVQEHRQAIMDGIVFAFIKYDKGGDE